MKSKSKKRLLALLLSLTLIVTFMPTALFAYATGDDTVVTQGEQTGGDGTDLGDGSGTDGTGTDLGDGTGTDLGDGSGTDGTGTDQTPADTAAGTGEPDAPVVDEPLTTESNGDRYDQSGKDIAYTDDNNIELIVSINPNCARNVDGHWVKDINNVNAGEEFQYNIELDFNEQVYREYEKGAIQITIPAGILKHMNYSHTNENVYDPALTRSLEDGTASCSLPSSIKPKNQATEDDDWYYDRVYRNGRYWFVIVNNKKMSDIDANTVEFQVIYKTTQPSYQYADYNPSDLAHCASDTFDVHLEATYPNGTKTQADAHGPEVYLNTTAEIAVLNKDLNATWEGVGTDANGTETDYLYLQYKIEVRVDGTSPSSKPTQQYDLILDDAYEGAFSNMMADWSMSGQVDGVSDAEYELVGYSSTAGQDESTYTKNEDGTYVISGAGEPQQYIYRYVLVRVPKPADALHLNYTLDNNIHATVDPLGGGDRSTDKYDPASFRKAYDNTRPTGRFMIHKWSNSNWDSADHSRTDAYGNYTNYKRDWGHQNNELNFFKNGSIDTLRELRYFTWFEGYSVRYTPYTEPHELSYEFTDQHLSIEYYTSRAPFTNGLLSSRNCALEAADYFFSEIDFYPEASNATYDAERQMWNVTKSGDPFAGDDPIIIEAKFGSYSADWTPVAEATYHKDYSASKANATGSITALDSRVTVSFGTYEGEKYEYSAQGGADDTGFIIKFNTNDCVAYRIRHTNDHYYFMCNVKTTVNLKNTTHVKNNLTSSYVYIANFADMSVYDEASVSETNPSGRIFNFNDNAGVHNVNRVAGAAAVTQNNLMRTNKYLMSDKKDDDNQLYKATWLMNGAGYAYAGITGVGQEYPSTYEKLNKGTFFDMLPRGSEIYPNLEGVKVYNVLVQDSRYLDPNSIYYKPGIEQNYLLSPDDYTVDLIEGTYNNHSLNGLTMLKVTINKTVATDDLISGCLPGYTVVYDTVSYYEDLDRYGNTVLNATAFEAGNGTTYHEMGFPDDPRGHDQHKNAGNNNLGNSTHLMKIPETHPDRENVLDALTDLEPRNNSYWFDYDYAMSTVYYNQYNLSGLSKRVRLAGETSWGIRREVEPGGQYQYRIRYSTNSGTSVKDVILYDNIERYVSEEGVSSEWYGTLNSLSFELPRGSQVDPASFKYYVSTADNAVVDGDIDLTSSVWTQVAYDADLSDMEGVKWVAVDTTGYTLPPSSSMSLILTMTAPDENVTNKAWPTTYNDSHCKGFQILGSGSNEEQGTPFTNVSNHTEVIYTLGGELKVKKIDENGDPLVGVEFILEGDSSLLDQDGNPAHVHMTARTDYNGYAVFENVPLSGDGSYTLTEIVPDGYEDTHESWEVKILPDGSTQIDGEAMPEAGFTIVNKEGTVISVIKRWKRVNGYWYAPSGGTATLELYADGQPTGETVVLDGVVDTKQPDKAGYEYYAWRAKFTGLPKYKTVLGIKVEIEYTVVEIDVPEGFEVTYEDDKDYAIDGGTITNTEQPTEYSAEKVWVNLDGSTTPPEGAYATFWLCKRTSTGYVMQYKVVLDGIADPDPEKEGGYGYESEPWKATFINLPQYEMLNGQWTKVEYRVWEAASWWQDYQAVSVYDTDGVITNKRQPTTISARKRWRHAGSSAATTNAPEGATVTLELYADGVATGYTVILDGTVDTEVPSVPGAPKGYEKNAWEAYFVNIPLYRMVDDRRVPIQYTVVETEGWPGFTEPTEAVTNNGYLYNTEIETEVTAEKDWDDGLGNHVPPAGARVTFTLYADGVATNKQVLLDGTVNAASNYGYEYEAWKAKFPRLPKYRVEMVNGVPTAVEIRYTVRETITWPGYTATPPDGVADGGVITNTQDLTDVTVTKAWMNADGSNDPPDDAEVTFRLYADGALKYTVTLDGEADASAPAGAGGYESAAWVGTFANLPKYRKSGNNAVEIQYTVREYGSWPGYTVSYGDESQTYAVDGGTITNTQETTSLAVEKLWKNSDGSTTSPDDAEVTFTLYADGVATGYTVTLDGTAEADAPAVTGGYESVAWTAEFVNLPKYKIVNGSKVAITYTVKETGTWTGYKVIYDDSETAQYTADGGQVSNEQVSAGTEINVNKVLTGRDYLDGDSWTFTITGVLQGDTTGTATVPMPEETSVTLTPAKGDPDSAQGTFGTINYTWADAGKTYVYTITETGNVPGVINAAPVTVTVRVVGNSDGTLTVTKTPDDASYEFENVYKASGWTDFEIKKNLEGRTFQEGDEWIFTLTPKGNAPMPVDEQGNSLGNPYTYVLNTSSGITVGESTTTFVTDKIHFTEADIGKTYTYTITESGTVAGVTNDTTTYTVKITIKDNGDGTLKITKQYTRPIKLIPVDPPFVHKDTIDSIGAGLGAAAVTIPEEAVAERVERPYVGELAEIERPGGEIVIGPFDPITPIDPGDDHKLVEVTKNAEFTNVYEPVGTAQLKTTKAIDNWPAGETFTFMVEPVDGAPMPVVNGAELTELTADASETDPEAVFDEITYNAEGTYTYHISEVIPDDAVNAAGTRYADATEEELAAGGFVYGQVQYDSTIYTATVTVSEKTPKDGTLTTTVTYGDDAAESLTITNRARTSIELTKILDGYVDAGTYSNVTLAFEVNGYQNGTNGEELVYHRYVGMTFNIDDVDENGVYTKTIKLEDIPFLSRVEVNEVYSSNYTGETPDVQFDDDKGMWTVTIDNSHSGYTPGSGVINKYQNGTVTQEGLIPGDGPTGDLRQ